MFEALHIHKDHTILDSMVGDNIKLDFLVFLLALPYSSSR